MSYLFSGPPDPPNPQALAGAQTATNIGTAVANSYLNNQNQVTPSGSLSYDVNDTYTYTDPTSGAQYQIPRWTQTQTLGANEQAIKNQSDWAKLNLAETAAQQSEFMQDFLSHGVDVSGAPKAGSAASLGAIGKAQTTFGDPSITAYSVPKAQTTFANTSFDLGSTPLSQKTFGETSDYNLARSHVEDALFQRLNPQLDRSRAGVEQRLADQGIRYGSQAYQNAMSDYNREANDLRLGVTVAGSAEQEQAYTQDLRRGQFYNAGLKQDTDRQEQEYEQALGRGTFANQALRDQLAQQQQGFTQDYQRGQFSNAALAQQLNQAQSIYNAENLDRSNYLTEQYTARNQPINEISALLSGSQVSPPQFRSGSQTQIPVTDIAGLYNTNFNQQQGNYNSQAALGGNIIGGALGGAAGIYRSDRRAKKNIHRVGSVFAATPQPVEEPERKKLPIYDYQYKDDPSGMRHIGPMAQDVEKIDPGAVRDIRGTKYIDKRRMMGGILRAA